MQQYILYCLQQKHRLIIQLVLLIMLILSCENATRVYRFVADCQEVQVGGILFGTSTRMLGLKSCSECQEQRSCIFSVVSKMT